MLLGTHEYTTAKTGLQSERMAAHSGFGHAGEGASLAHGDAVQLGTPGRHHAILSRSCEKKRSALFGSLRVGRSDPRAAWLSPAAFGYRILGSARSRHLRFSERWIMGIDCALARYWLAGTEASVSQFAATGL